MVTEVVMSPVKDENMKDVKNSPVWKNCYHKDEMTEAIKAKSKNWFEYHVKFDGLKPTQCTKYVEK